MRTRWLLPVVDPAQVRQLQEELKLTPLAARVLVSRGFLDPASARAFLRPSWDDLHSPYKLTGMESAVDRIRRAIELREKILVYGDYDVDGTMSVVILTKAIELAGGQASYHVPHRLKEGYGMHAGPIESAAREGVRLVISVDTGIRAGEAVRQARTLGMDVIITDHHLPDAELPPAEAVLNPNRRDCAYPDKNLCGAGVAFKLVQALLGSLGWSDAKLRRMLESFLKLVAIATVADVTPLVGENRAIVKHGLEGLTEVKNPGLRALFETAGLRSGRAPSARQIAFQVAPRINAAGRIESAGQVIALLTTADYANARTIAEQLNELNQQRQRTEADIVSQILEECARTPITPDQSALVFSGANWHRGVVGIVASRLVERFFRPVFVLSEEEGELHGSGRSIPAFHLVRALETMPELFNRFGGHRQAAGLSMAAAHLDEFRERLNAHAAAGLTASDLQPQSAVDTTATLDELNDRSAGELLAMAPFGHGNEAPLLGVSGVEVGSAPSVMKDRHLRMEIRQGGRRLFPFGWNLAGRAGEVSAGQETDVLLAIEEDTYAEAQGTGFWSPVLKDFGR